MNVERLHTIAAAFLDDIGRAGVVNQLDEVARTLEQLAQQPGQPQYQEAVSAALSSFRAAIDASKIDQWPAAWRETLDELGAEELVGAALVDQVDAALSANEITPQSAAAAVRALQQRVAKLVEELTRILTAFERLGIATEDDLEFGDTEVMVTIPRRAVHERFDDLADEFEQLDRILGVFVEIATGDRESMRVRAIASSDFGVYLETTLAVGDFIAHSIERLLAGYGAILTIRTLRQGLADNGTSPEVLDAIDRDANARMDQEIKTYVDQVVAERIEQMTDTGRGHELTNELTYALRRMAERIDAGYNFDVRTPEPPEQEPDEEGNSADLNPEMVAAARRIIDLSDRLKYVNRTGETILSLPEGSNGSNDQDNSTAPSPAD